MLSFVDWSRVWKSGGMSYYGLGIVAVSVVFAVVVVASSGVSSAIMSISHVISRGVGNQNYDENKS